MSERAQSAQIAPDRAAVERVARIVEILEKTLGTDIASADTDLLESGVLDSLGLIEVVTELEAAFGVEIPFESLELDDLRSASSLARLLGTPGPAEVTLSDVTLSDVTRSEVPTPSVAGVRMPGGWEIRALERDQLPQVTALLLKKSAVTPEQAELFTDLLGQFFLDHPQVDDRIPSLVALDDEGRLIGFIGSSTRQVRHQGSIVSMACSGPLIVDPDIGKPGVGAFLMERYLSGPQSFTITDSATDTVVEMWTRLGGNLVEPAERWTVVLRPATYASSRVVGRSRPGLGPWAATAGAAADRVVGVAGRWLLPKRPTARFEPLTPRAMYEAIETLPEEVLLRPAYSEDFLAWQFDVLGRVGGGEVRGALVRDESGAPAGWYLYLTAEGGVSQVLQIGGHGSYLDDAFAHLVHDASDQGVAVLDGRVEPHLQGVLDRRIVIRRTSTSSHPLRHTADPELAATLAGGSVFLTRFDGESWMGAFGQAAEAQPTHREP